MLRHNDDQDGRGKIIFEDPVMRLQYYQGKIMHAISNNFQVLYVLKLEMFPWDTDAPAIAKFA